MAKLEKKQKIIIGITVPLVIAVIVIVSVLAYFIYFPYQKGEVEKATSINLPSDGVVRVLQLTDLHLVATKTLEEDKQTLKWVEEAIERAKPDIVAVTGDAVGSLSPFRMRDKSLIDLAEIFEEKQVYWMLTFGNHDGEWSYASGREVGADNRDEGKKELAEKYLKLFCKKADTAIQYVQKWIPIVAASRLVKAPEEEKAFLMRWIDVVEYE